MWNEPKKFGVENWVHAAIMWVLWLRRNSSFFNKTPWSGLQVIWRDAACKLAQWSILFKEKEREKLMTTVASMEHLARAPPLLLWPDPG